jgi:hypothetical protein
MRERVSLPGERALCWALAAIFSSPTPWQYLSEHPACVDNLIHSQYPYSHITVQYRTVWAIYGRGANAHLIRNFDLFAAY